MNHHMSWFAIALLLQGDFTATLWSVPLGPIPQVPEGGGPPGPFPNTSVTAVNVLARGSSTFNSSVEVFALEEQGPIAWSLSRYNRGDFAMRLSPADPAAALTNLGQGFIEYADTANTVPAHHAWRPSPLLGVIIPTARQNGPVNWNDGEGPFYPTIAIAESSSGPGFDMVDGSYGNGNLDINTGRAGSHASSPEANFSFSVTWFPYDQGWLGGEAAGPDGEGTSRWTSPGAHAAGLSAGLIKWPQFPEGSGLYGGLASLTLPGVDSLEDGMLFATSSDGSSDLNIVGVAPAPEGGGWLITIREDSATDAETLVDAGQSEFQFVYVPFNASNLIGGHINGTDGARRKAVGEFSLSRSGTGLYTLTIPGKSATNGTLLLQAAGLEAGTSAPLALRAFLTCQYTNGAFVIQSRQTISDTDAGLVDASFYFAWIDFATPPAPPAGPRFRSRPATAYSPEGVVVREAGVAASSDLPEVLVTTIDADNAGGYVDPITQQPGLAALIGRFYHARTLAPTSDPFVIVGNPNGGITRHDVKYNPVSKQYVVVANARTYTNGLDVVLIALVDPANTNSPVARAFAHHPTTDQSYDDVAVAVSSRNGHFLLVAERKFQDEGEGTVGALYDQTGNLLTPSLNRLDLLQQVGDEDDPDVVYLSALDAFLYLSNTDNSNGSTGTLSNRIVASLVDATPGAQGQLVTRPEQPVADGEPAGTAEGHPASLLNPFNQQLITAYDAGNNTASGSLSYYNLGTAPSFAFTPAGSEVAYLSGSNGAPFRHQHPQLAADPVHGVIVVGFNATSSDLGLPEAYAFRWLGPDGRLLPSQLNAPYLLADAPGGLGNSANYHNIIYSPAATNFVAAFNSNPGVSYLTALEVTSSHLDSPAAPSLNLARSGPALILTWPADATGFRLQVADQLTPVQWRAADLAVTVEGGLNRAVINPSNNTAQFYRLQSGAN